MTTSKLVIKNSLSTKFLLAFSIEERAALLNNFTSLNIISESVFEEEVYEWMKVTHIKEESLELRLESEGITLQQFGQILYLSKQNTWIDEIDLKEKQMPSWFKEIGEAFDLNRSNEVKEIAEYSLSYAFRPFLLWASNKIKKFINDNPHLNKMINPINLTDSLVLNLEKALIKTGIRTFIFELHVSKEMGELTGNTSNERYNSFIEKLVDPEYLEFIYSEYPVLARLLMSQSLDYIENIKQCLKSFSIDYPKLSEVFDLKDESLFSIETDLGDSHQRGKTVMRFKFSSGKEIMYKPKSLELLQHFNDLLEWFNLKGVDPQFNQYKSIHLEKYAWEERVEYNSCNSYEEISRYYKRLGGLLGVLYMINGLDFHSENIIASGENPLLIDIETLFHHHPKIVGQLVEDAEQRAKDKLFHSVLNIGLLPHLSFKTPEGKGIDLGGISISEAPVPIPIFHVENDQTDEIRFVLKDSTINKLDQNVPKLKGELVEATDFVDEFTDGFDEICKIILKNKDELTSDNGIIAQFNDDRIRIIIRATQYYGNFVTEATHPDYLRDWIERDKLMEKVWFTVLDPRTIAHEKKDLLNNDIPFFYTSPGTRDLFSSDGKVIPNYNNETSNSIVVNRIQGLNLELISEQIDYIKMSILSKKEENTLQNSLLSQQPLELMEVNTDLFIKEAIAIGDKIINQAIYGEDGDVTWISLDINYFGQWDVSVLGKGLYNGLSGLLIFSTYLYEMTKEERFKVLANKISVTIIKTPTFSNDFKSAFFGQASIIYALGHYIKIFGSNEKIESYIFEKVQFLGQNIENEKYLDLLGGSAGIIQVLLNVYDQFGFAESLEIAKLYGNHLLKNQQITENGVAWSLSDSNEMLGGFSHGTSGVAWSLLRLYKYSDNKDFFETALNALEYDRSLFNPQKANWEDLRGKEKDSISWCHGAAGIGMSRILYLRYINDPELLNEIEIALTTTVTKGLGKSHSLCHGDLGNSELFCLAAQNLGNQNYLKTARSIGMKVLQEKNETGKFSTGVTNNIDLPGLFLGVSGIGLQLLRLADPQKVPSVLTLE